jgi:hypothetical protein
MLAPGRDRGLADRLPVPGYLGGLEICPYFWDPRPENEPGLESLAAIWPTEEAAQRPEDGAV